MLICFDAYRGRKDFINDSDMKAKTAERNRNPAERIWKVDLGREVSCGVARPFGLGRVNTMAQASTRHSADDA